MQNPIATIGYERAPLAEVIQRLQDGGVELLIDVRAVAASRRAGFSKTMLSGSLAEAGIDYRHLRDLGTPKDGRIAARAGRHAEMQAIFNRHMMEPEALGALESAISLTGIKRACLLCYEHDPAHCHRTLVAERIQARTGAKILHL
jgi:uncharacterized protein (DUF488 family)